MRTHTGTVLAYVASAAAMLGAGAYLIFGSDRGLGIFLLIIAVIVSRVLILGART